VSGGASYEMSLAQPVPVVDTILRKEPHNVYFVEYLRIAIGYGGFPGVAGIPGFPMNIIHDLRQGLLPF
jgi:hypothetical protein